MIKESKTFEERYKHLNKYYKEKFGERTLKICVNGDFTCPNRDGKCGTGGCIFCSEKGSGELIKNSYESIANQVKNYFDSYRSKRANKFIVYFQNFSNTYDSLKKLKQKYDSSLVNDKIVGISIATRPDCINDDIAELINSYSEKYYVCVELGLQTADDDIGKIINRGYDTEEFIKAVRILKNYKIDVVTHLMCGLPGEDRRAYFKEEDKLKLYKEENLQSGKYIPKSIINTVGLINNLDIDGIKIHSTYVVENTKLNELYQQKKYIPFELEEYFAYLTYIVTHLNPNIVIHRICADAPKDILVAPDWNAHKKWVMNGFDKILKENDLFQGKY